MTKIKGINNLYVAKCNSLLMELSSNNEFNDKDLKNQVTKKCIDILIKMNLIQYIDLKFSLTEYGYEIEKSTELTYNDIKNYL